MSNFNELEVRTTNKTNCHCKVCDKLIKPDVEKVFVFRSIRGHMDTTHICFSCIKKMNELINEGVYNEKL
jgi:hypothetical protein